MTRSYEAFRKKYFKNSVKIQQVGGSAESSCFMDTEIICKACTTEHLISIALNKTKVVVFS